MSFRKPLFYGSVRITRLMLSSDYTQLFQTLYFFKPVLIQETLCYAIKALSGLLSILHAHVRPYKTIQNPARIVCNFYMQFNNSCSGSCVVCSQESE